MHISMEGLTKTYEKTVLDIPHLKIESGSFWGIIGPNGSGKSTLMKIVAGLTQATAGKVLYDGQPLSQLVQASMTLVFQKPYLLRTSVYQNIAYPLQIRGLASKGISDRVEEMLEKLDIQNLRDQRAWTLSGGEAQKVALARALVFRPRLLMLDEPTANIDPASILHLERIVREYYDEIKPTILMVTHNVQQTKRTCEQVAFMYRGEVLEKGSLEQVFDRGNNPLVKTFIQEDLL